MTTAIRWTPHELWLNAATADIDPDDEPIYRALAAENLPRTNLRPVQPVVRGKRTGGKA